MSDCVIFTGHIRKTDGYGIVGRSRNNTKRIFLAHRWVWALHHGKDPWLVPRWVQVKQSCKNRACVNPEHLVTDVDDIVINALRDVSSGTGIKSDVLLSDAFRLALPEPAPVKKPLKTKGAMAHQLRTECMQGHAFREAPDDTPCIPCQILKSQDSEDQSA